MAIETQSGAQRENAFQNTLGLRLHATAKLASSIFASIRKHTTYWLCSEIKYIPRRKTTRPPIASKVLPGNIFLDRSGHGLYI
jgi:hypothetical protein